MVSDRERLQNCVKLSNDRWASYHDYTGHLFMYVDSDGAIQQEYFPTMGTLTLKHPDFKKESSLVIDLGKAE